MSEAPMRTGDVLPEHRLPEGAVLLHIGFHKTGTTAIQDAFTSARPELERFGLLYPGKVRQHHPAALSLVEQAFGWKNRGGRKYDSVPWERLRETVTSSSQTVVLSSEFFAEGTDVHARRAVTELGADRVHVVATLRAFDRILPSSWQQHVKNGLKHDYETWLKAMLSDPPNNAITPSFWRRHQHGAVLRRWADAAGPDRVTVICVDETDRSMLFRSFEQLLRLPETFLENQPRERENRSLTAVEAELIRRVNRIVLKQGVTWDPYHRVIREGAVRRLVEQRTPPPEEQRIVTPAWALDRAAELARQTVADIKAAGIRVIGDVESLTAVRPPTEVPDGPAPSMVPMDVAVETLVGTFNGKEGRPTRKRKRGGKAPAVAVQPDLSDDPAADVSTRELASLLGRRLSRRVRRSRD